MFDFGAPIEVVHNFFVPRPPRRPVAAVRRELDPGRRRVLGKVARTRARELFTAEVIVPRYEALYRRLCR